MQRMTVTPENAYRIMRETASFDVRHRLAEMRVPTMVVHCRDDAAVPFSAGQAIAATIPGAQMVPLEGRNHILATKDTAWPRFVSEIGAFIARHAEAPSREPAGP